MNLRNLCIVLLPLLFIASCKKKEADFRDALVGNYITTTSSWASYPTPPNYYDSTVYLVDTVYVEVTKSQFDEESIIVMADTYPLSSRTDSTAYFFTGCCHHEKIVEFWSDSIRIIRYTGGSAASSFADVWTGKKL